MSQCMLLQALLAFIIVPQCKTALIKSVNLTTSNTNQTGATISKSSAWTANDVSILNNMWNINVSNSNYSQRGYHLQIDLDNTWGFHPNKQSMISLTIYSPTTLIPKNKIDLDLLLSFSVNNTQYITHWLALDNMGSNANTIYPACDTNPTPTQSLATGDVKACVESIYCNSAGSDLRDEKANGGNTGGTNAVVEPDNIDNTKYNAWPINIQLINNPTNNTFFTYINEPSWGQWNQGCGFGQAFDTNLGLQIYIALDDGGETLIIDTFQIEYSYNTENPTSTPTKQPTFDPTFNPTVNPTTFNPTNLPSAFPTHIPSNIPSQLPSITPSNNPSESPTIPPTTKTLIIGINGPTLAPIMNEGDGSVDVENVITTSVANNTDMIDNEADISNTSLNASDIVILMLSLLIVSLLCIIGVYCFKQYKKKRIAETTLCMTVSSDSGVNTGKNASVPATPNNVASGDLMDMNNVEGDDGANNILTMLDPTPNGYEVKEAHVDRAAALSLEYEDMYIDEMDDDNVFKQRHKKTTDITMSEHKEEHTTNRPSMDEIEHSYSNSGNDMVTNTITVGNKNGDYNKEHDSNRDHHDVISTELTDLGEIVTAVDH